MARVDIRGAIIPNDYKWFYDLFDMESTCPADVKMVIDNLTTYEALDVYINSGGGEIASGSEIYTMLRALGDRTRIHVTGEAHSAASIIAMAGWCEMAPTALMMVHCVSSYADGNHNDMEHAAEVLRTADKALCTAYTEKTGMTEEEALAMMERETWLRAADAKNLGLIDEIMFDSGEQPTLSNSTFKLPTRDQMERARAMMERRDSGKEKIQTQLNLLRLDARRLQNDIQRIHRKEKSSD